MAGDFLMARGKHAASAAARRAAASAEELDSVRAQTAARVTELEAKVQRMTLEAQQLRGQITRRAHEIAGQQVAAMQERHRREVDAMREDCDRRIRRAFELVSADDEFRVRMDRLADVARELGLQPIDLVPGAATGRAQRRNLSSAKKVRAINEFHRQQGAD